MNQILKNLQLEIEKLESQISLNSDGDYDIDYYNIEKQFEEIKSLQYSEIDMNILKNIQKHLKKLRSELDLFDEQSERDAMFTNGEDE
jgi:hypothetical protein